MPFLISHHGTYWFQIRVPNCLNNRYGRFIRQNLQTSERALAQQLAYQLASTWLSRFSIERQDALIETPLALADISFYSAQNHKQPIAETPKRSNPISSTDSSVTGSMDNLLAYWRKLHPECSPSTYGQFESVVKEFKKLIKKSPNDLVRTDISSYRDHLFASGLAPATVAKKISFIGTMLQTAFDAGFIQQNVARGMRIPKKKVQAMRRRAFSADELETIFSSSIYTGNKKFAVLGESAIWIPLLALMTGARLEEICQLKTTDLIEDDTYGLLIRISDEGDKQRIKTNSSRRKIPLHAILLDAGFMDYARKIRKEGNEWLFPELKPNLHGKRGAEFGRWFARYLRSPKGCHIIDRRVVFHSFRHTFKTLCREAGISEEIHDALTGHVGTTVGRNYGHVPLAALVDGVSRIKFPIQVAQFVSKRGEK